MASSRRPHVSPEADLASLGRFLTALGDPVRQRILRILSQERPNVGALAERLALSQPAVSHHLKILADAGLVRDERNGRERVYRIEIARCRERVEELRRFVSTCCEDALCC